MNGVGMMLKSFGIDPEMLAMMGKQMGDMMLRQQAAIERIEATLTRIEKHLGVLTPADQMIPLAVPFVSQPSNSEHLHG